MSQRQCAAGGAQLQRAPVHGAPLADGLVGSVHGGLVHPGRQHVSGSPAGRRSLLLGGDADAQGHLRPSQRGPSSPQEVGPSSCGVGGWGGGTLYKQCTEHKPLCALCSCRCPESLRPDTVRPCLLPCKKDCVVTPYSEWSPCPSSCRAGWCPSIIFTVAGPGCCQGLIVDLFNLHCSISDS